MKPFIIPGAANVRWVLDRAARKAWDAVNGCAAKWEESEPPGQGDPRSNCACHTRRLYLGKFPRLSFFSCRIGAVITVSQTSCKDWRKARAPMGSQHTLAAIGYPGQGGDNACSGPKLPTSNPGSTTCLLCNFPRVSLPFCALVFPSMKWG